MVPLLARTDEHRALLPVVIPVKYGVKNIRRIATIGHSTRRAAHYWAERRHEWYIGP